MGRRGPPPRPDSNETARGRNTYHAKKVALPPPVPVEMPATLARYSEAAWFWKQYAPHLIEAGYLRPQHAEAFASMCELYGDMLRYKAILAAEGEIVASPRGLPVAHPAVKMLRDTRRDFAQLAKEFGMTALATARIPKEEDDGEAANPLQAFGITG